MHKRQFLKVAGGTVAGTVLLGTSTSFYSTHIEPANIDCTQLSLRLPRLSPAFHGYRIAQLSDIHIDDTWMDFKRLSDIVKQVNAQHPDLIVITGDFVTRYYPWAARPLAALGDLHARDGIFSIYGNHDAWSGTDWLGALIKPLSINDLTNEFHTIKRENGAMLHIVGIEDLWPDPSYINSVWEYSDTIADLVKRLPSEGSAILLAHEPDFADVATKTERFDLQLSGHTHGGQVRIPLVGTPRTPPLGHKYVSGLYSVGSMLQYTNRGLGMVKPQVRFDCRPEITIIECRAL
ncbi:metallophosphoesterase [Ktedonobacter sp. SOSP1-52]|uniref:metallophosphoesterase n=1 Tax=Ktedonobacter sp. SOSP1-52 TaxID=2778366 RepID=UPI001915D5F7|nr:metallophosphoesterase [Ktedonobacter sp. SOSP1-52]GHO70518.1 metallophosphoesterase [Ktedonobacter sp. SOSP1-52]